MAGLYHFTTRDPGGHKRYDREGLAAWARAAVRRGLDMEDLKNKQRDEIRALLVEQSRRFRRSGRKRPWPRPIAGWSRIFDGDSRRPRRCATAYDDGRLKSLSAWLAEQLRLRSAAGRDGRDATPEASRAT